jgi:ATP-binding cassette subfamily F protein 3
LVRIGASSAESHGQFGRTTMIRLSGARKSFGPKTLFEGLDWLITATDRIGLVGGNGTGKSTLLKILGGIEHLEDGLLSTP